MSIGRIQNRLLNILLIEDSPMDTNLVKIALARSKRNSKLSAFENAEDAMIHLRHQVLRNDKPDLTILDLTLPGMDGWDVLKECQDDPELKSIPVVVFTTTVLAGEIAACYALGAKKVITKPLELEPFLSAVTGIEECLSEEPNPN